MTLDIPVTKNFLALEQNRARFVMLEGSTRSTKTYSILQYLIKRCMAEQISVFAGRHDGTTCDTTIVKDFLDVLNNQFQAWDAVKYNKQRKRAEFSHSGSVFEFGGTSDEQKLHGRKQDILWLNEVMEISWDARKQLAQRTEQLEIYDWNPSLTHHWVFERIMKRPLEEYTYVHSTYRDNPFLSDAQRLEIESYEPTPANIVRGTADPWHWQVYGLGRRAGKEGRIFTLWETTEDWPDWRLCQRHGYGLDFGFSQDPSALIECALFQDNLYLRQRLYEPGLIVGTNISQPKEPSVQGRLGELEIPKDRRIFADCAQPESIHTLQLAGWNLVPCVKGPNSVVDGINLMKQFRLKVHLGSQDLQRELENYTWDKRRDGVWLDQPIDEWNHLIDAARYWAMSELKPRVLAESNARRGPVKVRTVQRKW